jgi:predicted ATPase/class 3 adenylate cyclase
MASDTVRMGSLPTGTLTMLFSDIEGSTSLLTTLGDRWGEALSAHRRILRGCFEAHSGVEMGTEGDSFFVVFTSAGEALLAAVEAQRGLQSHDWPGGVPVRVRMGLHTGEPQWHEDSYIGLDVHRAARISATASGGQIVVSDATLAVLGSPPSGIGTRDLGWHRLKDLPGPEHLYDLVADGMVDEHRSLRSLGTQANLPVYPMELIGRARELAELCEAVVHRGIRLITLTGTGGTGKTRLAVAVASELSNRMPWDTFFVPLHAATRAPMMWAGIAEAVGAPADEDRPPSERTLQFLRDRGALLILDNLEQVEGADTVVSQLLDESPGVTVLATSRRPLSLVAEQQYPVAALEVPAAAQSRSLVEAQTGAVELFVRRAGMVKPGFALTPENVDDVITLCRLLDGLPLAIELAAARLHVLSPKALLKRIDDSIGQTETVSNRIDRQRTLASTISWSYNLLDTEDQRIFRTLGVFASRFDLGAVEWVAPADDRDPLDVVAHLVDVSLAQIGDGPDGEPTVWLLETIRRYARYRLRESGENDAARMRHARWCVHVAGQISGLLNGPMQMSALDRMDAVAEDIRAALDWCFTPGDWDQADRLEIGLSLLQPMYAYWHRFPGHVAEGRAWHDRALQALGSEVTDSEQVVDALHGQGDMALVQNDVEASSRSLQWALEMAYRLGDLTRACRESNTLGLARRAAGDAVGAQTLIESSLAMARQVGDPLLETKALSNLVDVHMDQGHYAAAVAAARVAIAAATAQGDPWGVAITEVNLILALLNAEGPHRAHEHLVDIGERVVGLGDVELSIIVVEAAACVWAGLGDARRAARLVGAADSRREDVGIPRGTPDQHHLDRFLEPVRGSVSNEVWEHEYRQGQAFTLQAAVADAISSIQSTYSPP